MAERFLDKETEGNEDFSRETGKPTEGLGGVQTGTEESDLEAVSEASETTTQSKAAKSRHRRVPLKSAIARKLTRIRETDEGKKRLRGLAWDLVCDQKVLKKPLSAGSSTPNNEKLVQEIKARVQSITTRLTTTKRLLACLLPPSTN